MDRERAHASGRTRGDHHRRIAARILPLRGKILCPKEQNPDERSHGAKACATAGPAALRLDESGGLRSARAESGAAADDRPRLVAWRDQKPDRSREAMLPVGRLRSVVHLFILSEPFPSSIGIIPVWRVARDDEGAAESNDMDVLNRQRGLGYRRCLGGRRWSFRNRGHLRWSLAIGTKGAD